MATIFLIEDSAEVRELLADVLRDAGLHVFALDQAERAVELIESGERPDVVVTDLNLSGGMNGLQLVATLREQLRGPRVPVVLITGISLSASEGRIADAVLEKPFGPERLVDLVRFYAGPI